MVFWHLQHFGPGDSDWIDGCLKQSDSLKQNLWSKLSTEEALWMEKEKCWISKFHVSNGGWCSSCRKKPFIKTPTYLYCLLLGGKSNQVLRSSPDFRHPLVTYKNFKVWLEQFQTSSAKNSFFFFFSASVSYKITIHFFFNSGIK